MKPAQPLADKECAAPQDASAALDVKVAKTTERAKVAKTDERAKVAKTDDTRKREIQLIHVGRAALKMDEATYRAMLQAVGRVKSSTELDWTGRKRVLDHMKKCGFTPTRPKAGKIAADESPQMKKIRAIWLVLADVGVVKNRSEHALAAYVKRQSGLDTTRWLHGAKASAVIEALKAWAARENVEVF